MDYEFYRRLGDHLDYRPENITADRILSHLWDMCGEMMISGTAPYKLKVISILPLGFMVGTPTALSICSFLFHVPYNIKFCFPCSVIWTKSAHSRYSAHSSYSGEKRPFIGPRCELLKLQPLVDGGRGRLDRSFAPLKSSFQSMSSVFDLKWSYPQSKASRTYLPKLTVSNINYLTCGAIHSFSFFRD